MSIGRFYGGVGALIWRESDGRYLLLKRAADKDFAGGLWECVTGRVDQGEGFIEAVHREVKEEIGVSVRLEFVIGTTHFYRGTATPENELIGVVFGCTLSGTNGVQLSREHSEYRWVTAKEIETMVTDPEPGNAWIKQVIARTDALRVSYPAALLDLHYSQGFDLNQGIPAPGHPS